VRGVARVRWAAVLVVATMLVTTMLSGTSAVATADDDPIFIPWTRLLPGLRLPYEPSSENLCNRGDVSCVHAVIDEMERRLEPLSDTCNHDAVFALTYLRTTEEYLRATTTPGFFQDPAFVNHEDAVFAKYYFDAYDAWHQGRRAEVPPAWRIAFQAADQRKATGAGNLLLGMSAHVNRDLPFVLEAIGLVKPDGTSRKRDHDQVDVFLNRVTEPVIAEVARRFDPSVRGLSVQGTTLEATALFQVIALWREEGWRNAELLAAAPTPAARALVVQTIETTAAAKGLALLLANSYVPLLTSSAGRDKFCAAHHNDP
jgi:hypothetical protein